MLTIFQKTFLSFMLLLGLSNTAFASVPQQPGPYIGISNIDNSSVRISFLDQSNNETGFRIYDGDTIDITIPANDETKHAYAYATLTGLESEKLYKIRVVAYNSDGDSLLSDERDFKITSTFGYPNEPGPYIGVTGIDNSSVRISFLDNSNNEDGFRIYDGSSIDMTIPANNETQPRQRYAYATLNGLNCNQTYEIKVEAFNSVGNSSATKPKAFNINRTFNIPCDEIPHEDPDLISVEIPTDTDSINKLICETIPESTDVFKKVDIMFLVDVSGSYGDDLAIFRARANEIITAFEEAGQDVQISLASFSDYPISPYGSSASGDYAFRLDQPLTNDFSLVTTAINNLTLLYGSDYPESQLEALFQSGEATTGWRDGALPIIFLATDASFHNSDDEIAYPGHGLNETVANLVSKGIKVFGLQSGGSIDDVVEIANLTDGNVFNLSSDSSEIVTAIESAISGTSTDISVSLEVLGDDADIIESITPNIDGAIAGDPILNVNPGDEICFNVVFTRGIYETDLSERIIYFQLKVVAEGVATIKEIPVKVKILARALAEEA